MARGPRIKLERGIFEDEYGRAAIVSAGGRPIEKRFPRDTPLKMIRQWRNDQATKRRRVKRKDGRSSLAKAADVFIDESKHLASWRELRSELRAWTALYGNWPRWRIGSGEVKKARIVWLEAGKSRKTINHRVDALRRLWRGLDGRQAPTPCDEIAPLDVPKRKPAPVLIDIILATYAKLCEHERRGLLRDRKTRARFMVRTTTGARPCEIMRAKPEDVDLERGVWLTRDAKGGYRPHGLVLNDDMIMSWRLFIDADAWGPFETSSQARVLHNCGWPKEVRPYSLRGTVGITLSEAGVDLADVQAFLGHTDPRTTRSAYVPVLNSRISRASNLLAGRFGWTEAALQKGGAPSETLPTDSNANMAVNSGTPRKRML